RRKSADEAPGERSRLLHDAESSLFATRHARTGSRRSAAMRPRLHLLLAVGGDLLDQLEDRLATPGVGLQIAGRLEGILGLAILAQGMVRVGDAQARLDVFLVRRRCGLVGSERHLDEALPVERVAGPQRQLWIARIL